MEPFTLKKPEKDKQQGQSNLVFPVAQKLDPNHYREFQRTDGTRKKMGIKGWQQLEPGQESD